MRSETRRLLDEAVAHLQKAVRVTVLTGAGISAESGVPTFRGSRGLWRNSRPEELASPEAFLNDPLHVWKWYQHRRKLISQTQPNVGHRILASWSSIFQGFSLITQNVDGLHERAGSSTLIPLHGSIWNVRCLRNCMGSPAYWTDTSVPLKTLPPLCPNCSGIARPDIVWFGESLNAKNIQTALAASQCDVFLSVGTSAVVQPASEFVKHAKRNRAFTVEINLERTAISDFVDISVQDKAGACLRYLDARLATR